MAHQKRVRNICFTLNNPVQNGGLDLWHKIEEISEYYVIGYEVGASGTPHWQGYLELKKQTSFALVIKMGAWHCEPRRSSANNAVRYCKKDGDYIEYGHFNEQGARGDIT